MPFKPTLSASIDSENQIILPAYASPKLDGIRAVGTATGLLSRSLKRIPNIATQEAYKLALETHPQLVGLDGELTISYTPHSLAYWLDEKGAKHGGIGGDYNNIQSVIMSANKQALNVCWNVFDVWDEDPAKSFTQRSQRLKMKLNNNLICFYQDDLPTSPVFNVCTVPQTLITSLEQLEAYEAKQLGLGYEGVMLRSPTGPYKYGRSTVRQFYLAKLKRFQDSEAKIVDFVEQESNLNEATIGELGQTKRSAHKANKVGKNTLGVLIAEHPTFGQIRVGTGQGLTAHLRKEIWDNQPKYEGQIIKFKYQAIGTQDKPRLPIFVGFRSPEDI